MASHREILKANARARRKRFWRRSVLVTVLAILTLSLGGWYLWNSPSFALTRVLVVNAEAIPVEHLTATANDVLAGQYFKFFRRKVNWFYPREMLLATLKRQFPGLAAVKVTNPSLGTLRIEVEERRGVALWCQAEICYFVDSTGFLYAPAPQFSNVVLFTLTGPPLPIPIGSRPLSITDWQQLLLLRAAINQLLQKAPDFTSQTITTVSLNEPVDYVFEVRNARLESKDWRLLVSRDDPINVIISRLAAAFSASAFLTEYRLPNTILESLDLRFKRRVFYKFMS